MNTFISCFLTSHPTSSHFTLYNSPHDYVTIEKTFRYCPKLTGFIRRPRNVRKRKYSRLNPLASS